MNKKESNKYADACNVANKFLDTVFSALNLKDAEKYHITEDELKDVVNDTKDKANASKEYIQELANGMKLDLSNLVETINTVFSDYKEKYLSDKEEYDCDECEYEPCCKYCNCCEGDDCVECDECFEKVDYTTEYCHDIKNRLAAEFEELSYIDETEDDEYLSYPYQEVLYDINTILDDFDNEDYELIPANDECKVDTVHIVYHIGYDTPEEADVYKAYTTRLADDLRELYGFSQVSICVDDTSNDEYMTFNIYMLM